MRSPGADDAGPKSVVCPKGLGGGECGKSSGHKEEAATGHIGLTAPVVRTPKDATKSARNLVPLPPGRYLFR